MRPVFTNLITCALISLAQMAVAQQSPLWEYVYPNSYHSAGNAITPFGDSGFVVGGEYGMCESSMIMVIKDGSKRALKMPVIPAQDQINDLHVSRDGKYLYVASTVGLYSDIWGEYGGQISKADTAGNIIWQKTYANDKWDADSGLVAVGVHPSRVIKLCELADGSIISLMKDKLILKHDSNGNRIWAKICPLTSLMDIRPLSDHFVVMGKDSLLVYDSSGAVAATIPQALLAITTLGDQKLLGINNTGIYILNKNGVERKFDNIFTFTKVYGMCTDGVSAAYVVGQKTGKDAAVVLGVDIYSGIKWESDLNLAYLNVRGIALNNDLLAITGYENSVSRAQRAFVKTMNLNGQINATGEDVALTDMQTISTHVKYAYSNGQWPEYKDITLKIGARVVNNSDTELESVEIHRLYEVNTMCGQAGVSFLFTGLHVKPGSDTLLILPEMIESHEMAPDSILDKHTMKVCLYVSAPNSLVETLPEDNTLCTSLRMSDISQIDGVQGHAAFWQSGDQLIVKLPSDMRGSSACSITDMQGRTISLQSDHKAGNGAYSYALPPGYATGAYVCRLICGKHLFTEKIIVYRP